MSNVQRQCLDSVIAHEMPTPKQKIAAPRLNATQVPAGFHAIKAALMAASAKQIIDPMSCVLSFLNQDAEPFIPADWGTGR